MKIKTAFQMMRKTDTRFRLLNRLGIYNFLSTEAFLKRCYKITFGRDLSLSAPQFFTEKLQWLKLYYEKKQNEDYVRSVDKITAKEIVGNLIGKEYIIPTLGCYKNFNEINFNDLPERFVIKCNHDSGGCVICKDKHNFNIKAARKKISKCLNYNFYYNGREWAYKVITPRILVEEYIEDSESKDLKDYKFFCFNGKVKCFKVDFNRFVRHQANYYDLEFHLLPFSEENFPSDANAKITIPNNINKMIEIAEIISTPYPFVRVDLYSVQGKIYFGEMTFFPASGLTRYTSEDWDKKLGSWLILPKDGGINE